MGGRDTLGCFVFVVYGWNGALFAFGWIEMDAFRWIERVRDLIRGCFRGTENMLIYQRQSVLRRSEAYSTRKKDIGQRWRQRESESVRKYRCFGRNGIQIFVWNPLKVGAQQNF